MKRVLLALSLALAAVVALALARGPLEAADPKPGGTLVIGLDQEPPTLDPHASPSAVTYQIIASVTESLLYLGRDGKLVPWLAESWSAAADGKSVTFKLRTRRQVPRRHAVQRRRGQVQLRPDRRSQVQGRRLAGPARRLRGLEGARRVHGAGDVRDAVRAVPDLRGGRPAQPGLPQGRPGDGRPGPHPPGRHRPLHDQGVRRQGPHDDGPLPGLHAEGAVERPDRPGAPRRRRVEVHPGGGDAGDDARERRDPGDLPGPAAVAAAPREETRPTGSRRCRGRARRASGS